MKMENIRFIGDSITCGYGVDDEDRDHHFATGTEEESYGAVPLCAGYDGRGSVSGGRRGCRTL